jgi:hypothetical protein
MNELPPLPEPIAWFADYGGDVFKTDQMRAYARAAIEAHGARKVPSTAAPVREPLSQEQAELILGHGLDNLSEQDFSRMMALAQRRWDALSEITKDTP